MTETKLRKAAQAVIDCQHAGGDCQFPETYPCSDCLQILRAALAEPEPGGEPVAVCAKCGAEPVTPSGNLAHATCPTQGCAGGVWQAGQPSTARLKPAGYITVRKPGGVAVQFGWMPDVDRLSALGPGEYPLFATPPETVSKALADALRSQIVSMGEKPCA